MSGIESIGRRSSLADEVIAQIESLIVTGTWAPGQRVPAEAELATEFGVSRSVVRDAIRTLSARGLLVVRHGVGTAVAAPAGGAYADAILMLLLRSQCTVGDLFDARAAIESGVVAAAARNRDDEDCADLARHVEGMEATLRSGDWRKAFDHDLGFHRSVIRAVHAPALTIILEPLHHVIASSVLVPDVDNPELFNARDHRRIYEAIVGRDEAAAREAMQEHFASRADPAFSRLYSIPCRDLADLARTIRDSRF